MSNKIACYIRVSTEKSDQQKSLEQQRVLLEEQYKDREILIYSDTGTGTSFKRAGFQQLMYDAGLNSRQLKDSRMVFEVDSEREPLFNEIVVINTSRFARNIAIIDVLRVLWNHKKVNVKFLDVQKNSSDVNDMILLQMFFAMAENEVKETSVRTKRGNKTTILQNRIRNNSIFGWDFDRKTNSLLRNENEAKVVEFIFKASLNNGLKMTAKLANQMGYRTKKGNLWTDSTIKTMIVNPKYKGHNVRNKFNNVNLFTESKTKYVKKENWIVQQNDRIEPLVTAELWEDVQKALSNRCIAGNKGQNARIYDTRGKLKCAKCGASYVRCVETKVSDKANQLHYLICSHKKKYTKTYCSAENINIEVLDNYIEKQRKVYYKNIQLQIQLKIISLQDELSNLNDDNNSNIVFKIQEEEMELERLKSKLESLIENFISTSKTMQSVIEKKIKELEVRIQSKDEEIERLKLINTDKEKHIRDINHKISKLKGELLMAHDKELTRTEWLDKVEKILIGGKKDIKAVYNLD
ncbi:recombinase family protein [Clostridium sp. UBA4548]|uniref:recombinase family protein n=1 Tax=Clostridium sp. UBA4548 TaxID=1946361 RepID=UPI0025BF949A|nr:recombinase family protein [Clostridium sp. UBA4548]